MDGLSRLRAGALAAVLVAVAGSSHSAAGAPPEPAVVLVASRLAGADQDALGTSVTQATTSAGWKAVQPPLTDEQKSCVASTDRATCAAAVAKTRDVHRAVVIVLEKEGSTAPSAWVLRGWVYDATGQILAFDEYHCSTNCALTTAANAGYTFAARLVAAAQKVAPPPTMVDLDLSVTPADAQVSVDGGPDQPAGRLLVTPGAHKIRITRSGYEPLERDVVAPAALGPLELDEQAPLTSRPRWPWYIAGGGAVSLGLGAIFVFVLDEDEHVERNVRAPTYTDWELSGKILLGVGSTAVIFGVGYALLGPHGDTPAPVRASFTNGGATVGWAGAF